MIFTFILLAVLPILWPLLALGLLFLGGPALIPEVAKLLASLVLDDFRELWRFLFAMKKKLTGNIVLITGAGRGLGRLMALDFARKGCIVVIWDKQGADEVAAEITKLGYKAVAYTCDLSRKESIYETADRVKKEVGDVDILINNAGVVTGKPFLDSSDELIELSMKVNSMAHFWTLKAFLPGMLRKRKGHVVTIASSAGLIGVPGLVDYCASKYAAVGIDESLRHELYKQNLTDIHTTVVCPFFINTGMFDGVTTRFPLLIPILDQHYAAQQIVNAVETNKVMLYMPTMIWSLTWLRSIVVAPSFAKLTQFLGVLDSMNDFKGRQEPQTQGK